jgi:enoyl-[acyl-carrier protein] reductase/trans-2-enoyl-CoA reductase (NAD+)
MTGGSVPVDENGLIRLDEFEMDPEVQKEVAETILKISEENLNEMSDFKGFPQKILLEAAQKRL